MRTIIILISCVILTGCSTIAYENAVGEKVSYSRFGSQNLNGVAIVKTENSVAVKIDAQRTSTEEIAKAVTTLADTAATFVKAGAK